TVVLANLPMFHVTGMQNGVTTPVWRGNTIVVMTRWDKACAARLIERHRCGSWTAIPTMLMDFLHQDLSAFDLSSMHILTGGGAAQGGRRAHPPAVGHRLRGRLRPVGNDGPDPPQPRAPAQAAMPGPADLRRRFARGRSADLRGTPAGRGRRDRLPRPAGDA